LGSMSRVSPAARRNAASLPLLSLSTSRLRMSNIDTKRGEPTPPSALPPSAKRPALLETEPFVIALDIETTALIREGVPRERRLDGLEPSVVCVSGITLRDLRQIGYAGWHERDTFAYYWHPSTGLLPDLRALHEGLLSSPFLRGVVGCRNAAHTLAAPTPSHSRVARVANPFHLLVLQTQCHRF
jgi:hypothetical protein